MQDQQYGADASVSSPLMVATICEQASAYMRTLAMKIGAEDAHGPWFTALAETLERESDQLRATETPAARRGRLRVVAGDARSA